MRYAAAVFVVLFFLAGLVACSEKEVTEQHFIFNNGAEPEFLDPAKATGHAGIRIINQLFEGLVNLDPQKLTPTAGAAEKWEVSPDKKKYTFYLRSTARWSDGSPLTAYDFRYAWLRVLTPATGAKYADQLYLIQGAQDYHKGRSKDPQTVAIRVKDPRILEVTLENPCSYFLELAAFVTYRPVHRKTIEKYGDRWTFTDNMIVNGPFKLHQWRERERIVMVKNENYWDALAVKLKKITGYPHENQDAAFQKYLSGAINWMDTVPAGKLEEAKRHPDFYTAPFLATYFYRFNCSRPPFDDRRVRMAFSLAVDRKAITDNITALGETPATWFCPTMPGYQPGKGLLYNKERARSLLSECGYGKSRPFPRIIILYNQSEAHKKIAEAVAQQWEENLGVSVGTRNSEWKSFLKDLDSKNYDVARSGWIGDYADPYTFYSCFVTNGGNNRTGWSHESYDRLLRTSRTEADAKKRNQLFHKMHEILVKKEFPIAPLYIYVNKGLLNPRVKGFHHNIRDLLFCKYIWMKE